MTYLSITKGSPQQSVDLLEPLNRATPITVPTSKPATVDGWLFISDTPRAPNQETMIPIAIASNDFQFKKN